MKKSRLFTIQSFSTAILAIFLAGCESTKIEPELHSPSAIISVIGNSYIPWVQEEKDVSLKDTERKKNDGALNALINKLSGSENPEILTAKDRLDYADESFRQIVSEISGLEFIEKDSVVKNENYKLLSESIYNSLSVITKGSGYKDFTIIGAKKAKYLMESLGAKSAFILNFKFYKEKNSEGRENQFLVGVVTMKVKFLDEKGHEIINKTYEERTPSRIKRYNSNYDKEAFVELFKEAIDNAIRKFAVEFMGSGIQAKESESYSDEKELSNQAVKLKLPAKKQADESLSVKNEQKNEEASPIDEVVDAKVEAAVTLVKKYKVSPEDAAKDMGAPLEKVLEALKKTEGE